MGKLIEQTNDDGSISYYAILTVKKAMKDITVDLTDMCLPPLCLVAHNRYTWVKNSAQVPCIIKVNSQ